MYGCTKTTTKAWHCELELGRTNNHTNKIQCMSIVITDVIERSGITFLYRKVPILDQYGKSTHSLEQQIQCTRSHAGCIDDKTVDQV